MKRREKLLKSFITLLLVHANVARYTKVTITISHCLYLRFDE